MITLRWGAKVAHYDGCGLHRGYPLRTFASWQELEAAYLREGVDPCRQCKPRTGDPFTVTLQWDRWGGRIVDGIGIHRPPTRREVAARQRMERELARAEAWVDADIARLERGD